MNLWRKIASVFSHRSWALAHYHTGLALSRSNDNSGAIAEYTCVIETDVTPPDLKAMALYNRALVHCLIGNQQQATLDLEGLVALSSTPVNVRTMARQRLVRLTNRATKTDAPWTPISAQ